MDCRNVPHVAICWGHRCPPSVLVQIMTMNVPTIPRICITWSCGRYLDVFRHQVLPTVPWSWIPTEYAVLFSHEFAQDILSLRWLSRGSIPLHTRGMKFSHQGYTLFLLGGVDSLNCGGFHSNGIMEIPFPSHVVSFKLSSKASRRFSLFVPCDKRPSCNMCICLGLGNGKLHRSTILMAVCSMQACFWLTSAYRRWEMERHDMGHDPFVCGSSYSLHLSFLLQRIRTWLSCGYSSSSNVGRECNFMDCSLSDLWRQ